MYPRVPLYVFPLSSKALVSFLHTTFMKLIRRQGEQKLTKHIVSNVVWIWYCSKECMSKPYTEYTWLWKRTLGQRKEHIFKNKEQPGIIVKIDFWVFCQRPFWKRSINPVSMSHFPQWGCNGSAAIAKFFPSYSRKNFHLNTTYSKNMRYIVSLKLGAMKNMKINS